MGGLPWVWIALKGGSSFYGVGVLAVQVCFLGGAYGEALLMVGLEGPVAHGAGAGLVWRGWWRCLVSGMVLRLLRRSWVVVLHVDGWLQVGGLGPVCLRRWVMMVVGLVVVVLVVGMVLVTGLRVCTDNLDWDTGRVHVHHLQPRGLRRREDS